MSSKTGRARVAPTFRSALAAVALTAGLGGLWLARRKARRAA